MKISFIVLISKKIAQSCKGYMTTASAIVQAQLVLNL